VNLSFYVVLGEHALPLSQLVSLLVRSFSLTMLATSVPRLVFAKPKCTSMLVALVPVSILFSDGGPVSSIGFHHIDKYNYDLIQVRNANPTDFRIEQDTEKPVPASKDTDGLRSACDRHSSEWPSEFASFSAELLASNMTASSHDARIVSA
jgi:hypothetical protein